MQQDILTEQYIYLHVLQKEEQLNSCLVVSKVDN